MKFRAERQGRVRQSTTSTHPEQRRGIDAQLAEAMKGPFYGPFTVEEMIKHIEGMVKKRAAARRRRRHSRSRTI